MEWKTWNIYRETKLGWEQTDNKILLDSYVFVEHMKIGRKVKMKEVENKL